MSVSIGLTTRITDNDRLGAFDTTRRIATGGKLDAFCQWPEWRQNVPAIESEPDWGRFAAAAAWEADSSPGHR